MKTVIKIKASITLEMLPENYNGIVNLRKQHDNVMRLGVKEYEELVRKRFEKVTCESFNKYDREEGILNEVTTMDTGVGILLVSGNEFH